MGKQWVSKSMYEHPAKGVFGQIAKSEVGIYYLKVGGSNMSCPQDWAAGIHAGELEETKKYLINLPAETHERLRVLAFEKRTTLAQLVRSAVDDWLKNQ